MNIVIDPDVKAVAEFMQERIEARKLVGVADSLRALAPILWGRHGKEPIAAIELVAEPILGAPRRASIESHLVHTCVGDDSAAGGASLPPT